jgi:hypothetical protein
MKIKFLRDYEVKDGSGTTYKEGDTLECNDASANHFVSRKAAEIVNPGRKQSAVDKRPTDQERS